jgi:TPR repeat protein
VQVNLFIFFKQNFYLMLKLALRTYWLPCLLVLVILGCILNAYSFGRDAFSRGQYKTARVWYLISGNIGNPKAQNNLAGMYAEGEAVYEAILLQLNGIAELLTMVLRKHSLIFLTFMKRDEVLHLIPAWLRVCLRKQHYREM